MKKICFLLWFLSPGAFAQLGDQSYLLEYKKAVQLYADTQYDLAAVKFSTLADSKYDNPVVPYAYFYQALCQKNRNNRYQSRATFRQIFEKYPFWEKLDEARIIYAEINFQDEYHFEALKALDLILDPKFKSAKNHLVNNYIGKITSIITLKELQAKYPNEKNLAVALVKAIQKNRYSPKSDLELSEKLIRSFSITPALEKAPTPIKKSISTTDKTIKIALLLPFELDKNKISFSEKQYIYEFFLGAKIAEAELKDQDLNLEVFPYEVENEKSQANEFLEESKKTKFDAIVGPLYPNTNALMGPWAQNNKVVQVHPFSNNRSLIDKSNYSYLAQTSYETQVKNTLLEAEKFGINKTIYVYHSIDKKDSIQAINFYKIAKSLNYNVSTPVKFQNQFFSSSKGLVVYLGSGSTKFLQKMSQKKITNPVLAFCEEADLKAIELIDLNQSILVYCADYVSPLNENAKLFQKDFFGKAQKLPSYYAYLGHDIITYYGEALKDGFDIFKINLETKINQNTLLSGFNYRGGENENMKLPLLEKKGGKFIEIE